VQPSMVHGSSWPDFSGNPRGWTVEHWSSWAKQRPFFLRWESVGLSQSQSVLFFFGSFFREVHHTLTVYIKDQTWWNTGHQRFTVAGHPRLGDDWMFYFWSRDLRLDFRENRRFGTDLFGG
jgi:dTDP-4-dehydrorhamnose 3,5-epimerase-like enzyme